MKNTRLVWMILLVVAIISPCARAAVWNPDTDPNLKFNLNFEQNKVGPPPETNDVGPLRLVGTAYDYNNTDPCNPFHMWDSNAADQIVGSFCGDFRKPCDANTGKAYDCKVRVPDNILNEIFMMGNPLVTGDEFAKRRHTFTFWFDVPNISSGGAIIRHANKDDVTYPDNWWEIKILDGKLRFVHKLNVLRVETEQTLEGMGILPNTWHHAAFVYDMTAREASQMFVDGIQVDRLVTSYVSNGNAEIDNTFSSPVQFGSGDTEFEGLLDEIRVYNRPLTPLEVSILYQTDYTVKPFALVPFPNAKNVAVTTALSWEPIAGVTAQELFLDTNDVNMASRKTGNGAMNSATNVEIGGPLALGTTYYWAVDSNDGDINGPIWKFTTETGKAFNPVPANGEEDVNVGKVDLQWDASASAEDFNVYFSDNQSFVTDMCSVALKISDLNDINDPNFVVDANVKGETYYWRIVTNFPPATGLPSVAGDVWSFRTESQLIIVNTSEANATYAGNGITYPPKTLTFTETNSVVNGYLGDDDVAIFDFNSGSGLNLDEHYFVVVIPLFDDTVQADMNSQGLRKTSRPMAIHIIGDANFNCKIEASAPDSTTSQSSPSSKACSGGHRGSFSGEDRSAFDPIEIFGPGYGGEGYTGSSPMGAGGGYGGKGGDQARAGGSGGATYGYEKIPVPLGGSAGGFGKGAGGGGGGAVEIAATGNITFGPEAQLLVSGGKAMLLNYPAGGGSGGSARIIAGGNFANSGVIDANGGKGGDTSIMDEPTNPGGGGGGGRVSIFHGGSYTNTGTIAVAGGSDGSNPEGPDFGRSSPGLAGTVYESNDTPLRPNNPTPPDGTDCVDVNGKVTLKWYPGFGATKNEIYFGTSTNPPKIADINGIPAKGGILRAQQSYDVNVTAGQTYYWYIKATGSDVNGPLWSFDAFHDYKLVFNTSDVNDVNYNGQMINRLTCRVSDANGWEPAVLSTGSVGSDGVAIFDFNGFNYGSSYTIVVVPDYNVLSDNRPRRPLAIHVNGNFDFDGTLDISGDDSVVACSEPKARSGGFRGSRKSEACGSQFQEDQEILANYYNNQGGLRQILYHRFSLTAGSQKTYYVVTDPCGYNVFGPGAAQTMINGYYNGGGGGYGGYGGDSGRGYYYGLFAGGYPYGDKEVPVPFGGSAGGWAKLSGGGAGGGGVEIVATGSVTLGSNAQIYSEGGGVLITGGVGYPGGGGAGGSVRIIAGTTFSNSGIIDVNGGKGCDGSSQGNNTGGGGAGGRVAVFYGSGTPVQGTITVKGGARGVLATDGTGLAKNGQDGTVFVSNGSPIKASAPTPKNGDTMVYCPNSASGNWLTLKWYSGYNVASANDVVYFKEGSPPNDGNKVGLPIVATRGQHSSTVDVNILPNKTYYWKVTTAGTVSTDVWSFKTVNWQCQMPFGTDPNQYRPEWDTVPNDCAVNLNDFWYFAQDWRNPAFGTYVLDLPDLLVYIDKWLDCRGRTNTGCIGW